MEWVNNDEEEAEYALIRILEIFGKQEIVDYLFLNKQPNNSLPIDLYKYFDNERYFNLKTEVDRFLKIEHFIGRYWDCKSITDTVHQYEVDKNHGKHKRAKKSKENILKCLKSIWNEYISKVYFQNDIRYLNL
jgi:hypothetical protein